MYLVFIYKRSSKEKVILQSNNKLKSSKMSLKI